jgi:molybdopterin-guanine dinucleotide biosynthesis protein A
MTLPPHDLVVLAGGAGRRMGGADKAQVLVDGTPLLDRVMAAVPGAGRRIVVGPTRSTTVPVWWCCEEPPGGGPAAGLAAGLAQVEAPYVVVLAVDLPMVSAVAVADLLVAATGRDGAVGVDRASRDQPLLAAYDAEALRVAVGALEPLAGASMRSVLARLDLVRVPVGDAALDCDTWADVAQAEATVAKGRGGARDE